MPEFSAVICTKGFCSYDFGFFFFIIILQILPFRTKIDEEGHPYFTHTHSIVHLLDSCNIINTVLTHTAHCVIILVEHLITNILCYIFEIHNHVLKMYVFHLKNPITTTTKNKKYLSK